jgi:hypothetical protein
MISSVPIKDKDADTRDATTRAVCSGPLIKSDTIVIHFPPVLFCDDRCQQQNNNYVDM